TAPRAVPRLVKEAQGITFDRINESLLLDMFDDAMEAAREHRADRGTLIRRVTYTQTEYGPLEEVEEGNFKRLYALLSHLSARYYDWFTPAPGLRYTLKKELYDVADRLDTIK